MKRLFAISLSLMIFVLSSDLRTLAQEKGVDFSQLEKIVEQDLKSTGTPGAAIAIVSGDQVILAKGIGISNAETGAPVTPDMLFRIGGLTMLLTSAAVVHLGEEGKVKLDEPIINYLPGSTGKLSRVTLHQLLSHTAGISDGAPRFESQDESALANWASAGSDSYFFTEPGEVYSSNSRDYNIAGYVLEVVGKKPYAVQMKERIFKPLGMTRSTFRPNEAITYPFAQGHNPGRDGKAQVVRPLYNNVGSWPSNSLFTNVNDLARFVIAFMNEGKVDGKQALSASLVVTLAAPRTDLYSASGKFTYGLRMFEERGVTLFAHTDNAIGYSSVIAMAPKYRCGVVILTNTSYSVPWNAISHIFEAMLPLKAKAEVKPPTPLPVSEAEMANYVGKYYATGRTLEILIKDGKLILKQEGFSQNENDLPLIKIGENRFSFTPPERRQPLEFVLVPGRDGKIAYLHMSQHAMKKIKDGN